MQYIPPTDMPLIEALGNMFPDSSRSKLRAFLKKGRILHRGAYEQRATTIVKAGEKIQLRETTRRLLGNVEILFEDKHLLIVEKPCGLLSVATNFEKEDTLFHLLKKDYKPRPVYVVHRLDRETSGILVFALSHMAMEKFKNMFASHDLTRDYYALVEGRVKENAGRWESNLVEDQNYYVSSVKGQGVGRRAITNFKVIERTKKHTLLSLRLETGRKNQIRVHCQDAGHPILGDIKYGSNKNPARRLCLHAYSLGFVHPATGKKMVFESLIPKTFIRSV